MKILVTGRAIPSQSDRCTGQQLVQGFREAGHEAHFYGCFYGQPSNFLGAKECQEVDKWDLIVATEMNDGMPGYEQLYEYYKLKDVPKIYWDFDVSYNENSAFQRAGAHRYDGYLVGNKMYVRKFAERFNKPSLHLAYACSPIIHRRKPIIDKKHLVGFVGTMTPEREKLIGNVHCVNGVFGEALIDATNELYTMVHINQDACKGLVPGRPWETAGCGTTLLMDRASYDDFVPFIEGAMDSCSVLPIDGPEDIEAFRKMYDNPTGRKLLAERGEALMKYMHENHSYKKRAEVLLAWADAEDIL